MAIFLLGLNSYTTAQTHSSKIDSLDNLLKTLPEDTTRVNTLLKLCGVLSYSDTKRVQEVATETIDLSQKIDFKKGEGKGYVYMGYYYHRLGNEPRAIEFLLKALLSSRLYRITARSRCATTTLALFIFRKTIQSLPCFTLTKRYHRGPIKAIKAALHVHSETLQMYMKPKRMILLRCNIISGRWL
jgi:hypothetical protein